MLRSSQFIVMLIRIRRGVIIYDLTYSTHPNNRNMLLCPYNLSLSFSFVTIVVIWWRKMNWIRLSMSSEASLETNPAKVDHDEPISRSWSPTTTIRPTRCLCSSPVWWCTFNKPSSCLAHPLRTVEERLIYSERLYHIYRALVFRGTKGWHQDHKDVLPAYARRKHHQSHHCSPDGHDAFRQTGDKHIHLHLEEHLLLRHFNYVFVFYISVSGRHGT